MSETRAAAPSLLQVARVFAVLGTTSFGGGVVAYLRQALVEREAWFDDREFVRLLELSQTLPGLNAVNLAVLAGDNRVTMLSPTGLTSSSPTTSKK